MRQKINTNLIKRTARDWLKVLVLLLDEGAVLLLVILVLRFVGIQIPLPIIIIMALLVGAFVFIIHVAVLRSFHRPVVTGSEGMIGLQGRVVETLALTGAITVKGEYWKAKSVDDKIEVDENIEIVGVDGLALKVKKQ